MLTPYTTRTLCGVGLFRKMTSVSTFGAVDYRSDKERIARYTKRTMQVAQRAENAEWRAQVASGWGQSTPPPPPPGWYPDAVDSRFLRYFDGQVWTEHVHPRPV